MIITGRPPNYEQIVAAFPIAVSPRTIFAFGEDIYSPSGNEIPKAILMHEYKHCSQQFIHGPGAWWTKYIEDNEFRYQQELLGHVAEYKTGAALLKDRNAIARLLTGTAQRLIAPLYNYEPPRTLAQAMRDLKARV